ncbi:hypothetical protein BGX38DRAFT_345597 [Terfezia claveryi]|nr:hypothetical protein BGX38DRAFT_345597 [Terfezia claveryi]
MTEALPSWNKRPLVPTSLGLARPPTVAAPPILGPAAAAASVAASRLRSNSTSTVDASTGSAMATATQLGGLFAGGTPKLRKAKGAVETGGIISLPQQKCPADFLPTHPSGPGFIVHGKLQRPSPTTWQASTDSRAPEHARCLPYYCSHHTYKSEKQLPHPRAPSIRYYPPPTPLLISPWTMGY